MNSRELEAMLQNVAIMRRQIVDLWNAIFALPEGERGELRIRYTRAYESYREYLEFVKERSGRNPDFDAN